MTIEHKIIHDRQMLTEYIRDRFGLNESIDPADPDIYNDARSSSAGPIIWTQNRLMEQGKYHIAGCPTEPDDFAFLRFSIDGDSFSMPDLAPIARSRIFRTNVLPRPIDIVAARVSRLYDDSF